MKGLHFLRFFADILLLRINLSQQSNEERKNIMRNDRNTRMGRLLALILAFIFGISVSLTTTAQIVNAAGDAAGETEAGSGMEDIVDPARNEEFREPEEMTAEEEPVMEEEPPVPEGPQEGAEGASETTSETSPETAPIAPEVTESAPEEAPAPGEVTQPQESALQEVATTSEESSAQESPSGSTEFSEPKESTEEESESSSGEA